MRGARIACIVILTARAAALVVRPLPRTPRRASAHVAPRLAPLYTSTLGAAEAAAEAAVEAALSAALPATGGALFWELAGAFVAGGLFFTAVTTAATAVYAVGASNAGRGLRIFGRLVRRVWAVVAASFAASKSEWRADGKTNWREVRDLLWKGLGDAQRTAAEGVETLRQEASLVAFALGAPGLLTLQYVVDRLTPKKLAQAAEEGLRGALRDVKNPRVRKLELKKFELGDVSPKMVAARAYDVGPEAMAFDVDVKWASATAVDLEVYPTGTRGVVVPVVVRNVKFQGTLRVIMAPLVPDGPGYGALLVSLRDTPKIGLDVRVAGGEITRVPWLRAELEKAVLDAVGETMLWPRRIVVPSEGVSMSAAALKDFETSDPLLAAERAIKGSLRDATPASDAAVDVVVADEDHHEPAAAPVPFWRDRRLPWARPAPALAGAH